jgi:hypothetical protein
MKRPPWLVLLQIRPLTGVCATFCLAGIIPLCLVSNNRGIYQRCNHGAGRQVFAAYGKFPAFPSTLATPEEELVRDWDWFCTHLELERYWTASGELFGIARLATAQGLGSDRPARPPIIHPLARFFLSRLPWWFLGPVYLEHVGYYFLERKRNVRDRLRECSGACLGNHEYEQPLLQTITRLLIGHVGFVNGSTPSRNGVPSNTSTDGNWQSSTAAKIFQGGKLRDRRCPVE